MSYVRSVTKTFTVSGSTTVSYPASEHGGYKTVHYSESVPVTVNVLVETDEFDQAVYATEDNVDQLTMAVNSMNSSQTRAIAESSEKISDKLIDGFFHLINSDLSMQKAENKSELQAKAAMLMNLSRDMTQKLERMDDDLAKLRRHYGKIFRGLDEDLEKRIARLDREAFRLASVVGNDLIISPFKEKPGTSLTGMSEMSKANNLLVTARMKEMALGVLANVTDTIDKSDRFENSVSSILHPSDSNQRETEYMPVIYCQSSDSSGNPKDDIYAPEVSVGSRMSSQVGSYMASRSADSWKKMDGEDLENIEQSLLEMIENESADDEKSRRIYKQMMEFWQRDKDEIRQI